MLLPFDFKQASILGTYAPRQWFWIIFRCIIIQSYQTGANDHQRYMEVETQLYRRTAKLCYQIVVPLYQQDLFQPGIL